MKEVRHFFNQHNSFFGYMKQYYPDLYEKLFGEADELILDTCILSDFGLRVVFPFYSQLGWQQTAGVIILKYYDRWEAVYEILEKRKSIGYLIPETYKETTIHDGTNTQDNNSTDFITGFDNGQAETGKNINQGNTSTNYTTTLIKSGYSSNFLLADFLPKEIDLTKIDILSVVLADIKNEIALSIYK